MEGISDIKRSDVARERKIRTNSRMSGSSRKGTKNNSTINKLITEGGENFYDYLDWNGLANESDLIVLPSTLHYYYDQEELKSVKTLINLKKLNLIKKLDDFVYTVNNVLSPNANFIGCFTDHKSRTGESAVSKMYKKVINFLDSKTDLSIDKKGVSRLFESHGFQVIDMTEINGVTYFRTQNNRLEAV